MTDKDKRIARRTHGPSLSSPPRTLEDTRREEAHSNLAEFSAVYGVKRKGLAMIQLPVTSASEVLPVDRMSKKFQGEIAPTIPWGV